MDLTALAAFNDTFKLIGYAAILLAMWIITVKVFLFILKEQRETFAADTKAMRESFESTLKSQRETFEASLKSQRETFERGIDKSDKQFIAVIEEQSKRNNENFQVLNKFAESIELLAGQSANLRSDIANNLFCPLVRKETTGK